jgi:branched-chain amino acid aminotransferase
LGIAYIDGNYVPVERAAIPILDWGVTRSDATYDVVGVWNGRFFRLERHLDRFFASLERLRMQLDFGRDHVEEVLHGCVDRAALSNAYVSITCTRGMAPAGSRDPRKCDNRFYAYAVPYVWIVLPEVQEQGAHLHISQIARIPPESIDPRIKNYHWLDLVQAQFEAMDQGADLAVVGDGAGGVTEGHGFNLFVVRDGALLTPDRGVLHGITRQTVFEICAELALPCTEASVTADMVRSAEEVFATSTAGGVMPVTVLDGQPVGIGAPGPTTQQIRQTYWDWHADPRFTTPVRYEGSRERAFAQHGRAGR